MKPGDTAPDFELPDQNGEPRRLSTMLANGPVVLFFYPAAFTPGCTKEACHFRDLASEFTAAGVQRLGVSRDDVSKQHDWTDKHSFDYPLPLLGVYYIDLDAGKKKKQLQGFWGGPIVAGSYNDPNLFGTNLDLGTDVFANFVRGDDSLWVDGEKDEATTVKERSYAANLDVG